MSDAALYLTFAAYGALLILGVFGLLAIGYWMRAAEERLGMWAVARMVRRLRRVRRELRTFTRPPARRGRHSRQEFPDE